MGDQIVVALPFVEDGIVALRRLERDGVRTAALFVVSAAQAVLAAKTGASYVCIATDHLESHGQDSGAVLRDTRTLFDRHGVECEIVAVAGSYTRLVTAGLVAGADAVSVRPDALRSLIGHPMTDRAVDQMLGEFSRRPRADHA
jgi:transaldolase